MKKEPVFVATSRPVPFGSVEDGAIDNTIWTKFDIIKVAANVVRVNFDQNWYVINKSGGLA